MMAGCAAPLQPAAGNRPPRNPFLADSPYPIGHTNSAQFDSTPVAGPTAPSHILTTGEIETAATGPGHLGNMVSGPYADGRRVIWTNSKHDIVKMDYATLKVLATYRLDDAPAFAPADGEAILAGLKRGGATDRIKFGGAALLKMTPSDLASVYTLVDRDGVFYAGRSNGIDAYGDANPGNPDSPIEKRRSWTLPAEIPGAIVGINMTFDGWIVLATDRGMIVALSRDFSRYRNVLLPHSEESVAYNARMTAERRTGYNWIRNSIAVDEKGGIYVAADRWMEKVVWNGRDLSVDPRDGAWAAAYPDSTGYGTGSTPVLVGFGAEADRFVVISDGDKLMNLTLFWRDDIPKGWVAPAGALSDRVAGALPVTMGDPNRQALQSEQAVVAAGYDMMVVNNEPASVPPFLPKQAKGLLISILGDDPAYTPHGMEKFSWDPKARMLKAAWTNSEIASPNCVPYASTGANRVYTVGVREGQWTLEGIRLDDGRSAEHYAIGDGRFNTMFSGIYVDDKGRILYGGMFGAVRLNPRATP